ncbi:Glutathionyl-hydroquinone reductase YqjG [Linum perenne]
MYLTTGGANLFPSHRSPMTSSGGPRMSLNRTPHPVNPTASLFTSMTKLLWGPSLPPGLLISTVRTGWNTAWNLMMSQLAPSDPSGNYSRPPSKFRISPGRSDPRFSGDFHLYVGLPCPWAHRTLIVRALKGLQDAIPISVAAPGQDGSWEFNSGEEKGVKVILRDGGVLVPGKDRSNGCRTLKEVYGRRSGGYSGRATVPMLWDSARKEVVCNESYDIIEFFNSGLNEVAVNPGMDLSPENLKEEIDEWNRLIYPNINNGVYRCGFAQSQEAYDRSVNDLFEALDKVEEHLQASRYLCGERLTLADVCLFTTLIRFDPVYNVLFKCTKKKLVEYPNLHGYMRDIYQMPKVAETCNLDAIMDGYYRTLFPLNPGSICPVVPMGSEIRNLSMPHNRESLSSADSRNSGVLCP